MTWSDARLLDLSGITGVAELFSGDRGRGYCRHPDEAATVPACPYTGTDRHPWLGGSNLISEFQNFEHPKFYYCD